MKELIDVFRMAEISIPTRIRILKRLGQTINDEHGSNLTESVVYELVLALDPNDSIKDDEHYKRFALVDEAKQSV